MSAAGARAGLAAMVVATLLWGATFVVVRDALASVAPVWLVAARFLTATAVLGVVLAWRRERPTRVEVAGGLASAPFVAACYALQAVGLQSTTAGSSAFLTSAGTLSVAFVAWAALGQRPGARILAGVALALAGSALISWRGPWSFGRGEQLTLLGAVAYAGAIVIVARALERARPLPLLAMQTAAVAALVLPFGMADGGGVEFAPPLLARFAYLAVAGTVVAPWLQVLAQRTLPPARIGILFALEPVFALAFALAVGGERFVARWWAGAALILAAIVWSETGPRQETTRSRRATA